MILRHHLFKSAYARGVTRLPTATRRCLSSSALEGLQKPVQSYISRSRDPYLNLSIEHYLLQKAAPDSAVLFLYVNRPSIIIGRNQNPWLEVNLALLDASRGRPETEPPGLGGVDLVRRRSGGGTVFHDEGNVNWTVICPSTQFTRDKHAEMVVRALRSCGVERSRVNARHDIVLDQGHRAARADPDDTHSTPFEAIDFDTPKPLKVSGSAYKLTRNRALHHGTCLLSSPNLPVIPDYLHSPAKPFMTARGVESVSSPVGNILLSNDDFIAAVQKHFSKHYEAQSQPTIEVDEGWLEQEDIRKGYEELKSLDWTYLQTPQYSLSTKSQVLLDADLELSVRYGAITDGALTIGAEGGASDQKHALDSRMIRRKVHEVDSWESAMGITLDHLDSWQRGRLIEWLEKMLPRPIAP
ncbi:Putative lipoate-protein ligase A [Fulvia fulva]|uniref:Putative lipoate-protein ligase A n=1 Tax=Passalora fulva TaxID=5499 RepID=A0A9Q8PL09_PASFU|nr:Putative lipoate-protein ligase A [Fulvia fulva]KAK4610552.1 putative lipoate-protein ligase A [Fulvia fulva]KAK4611462.1 putative lipoate-protein ligase A [Fulvia fulva]UJO24435.1 Putative lipoate-protein ligase A [Fulvia fulva]WPV22296.1 Putative lipoate-protein ligase A [Fulvia fulva]WPV36803.1 Putative lipoate-protein ligase A [Fulvia fulva]